MDLCGFLRPIAHIAGVGKTNLVIYPLLLNCWLFEKGRDVLDLTDQVTLGILVYTAAGFGLVRETLGADVSECFSGKIFTTPHV